MQTVINLAQVSLSNKKVNFYTYPRLTFLKKNAKEKAYKTISEPLDFTIFWGGMPPDPPSDSRLLRSKLASSCTEVWLQKWSRYRVKTTPPSPKWDYSISIFFSPLSSQNRYD